MEDALPDEAVDSRAAKGEGTLVEDGAQTPKLDMGVGSQATCAPRGRHSIKNTNSTSKG